MSLKLKLLHPRKISSRHFLTQKWSDQLTLALIGAAILAAIATYTYLILKSSVTTPDISIVIGLVVADIILFLTLMILITRRMLRILAHRGHRQAGSSLQRKIVTVFSLSVVLPTLLVAIFAVVFFDYGIKSWFAERVSKVVERSSAIAENYLEEHKNNIKVEALFLANDLDRHFFNDLSSKQLELSNFLTLEAERRGLMEALVFQNKIIVAHSRLSFASIIDVINREVVKIADKGEVAIISSTDNMAVRALIKLHNSPNSYLIIGRFIDQKILDYIADTKGASKEYSTAKEGISELRLRSVILFLTVSLLVLLAVIMYGILFSGRLVRPITGLVAATQRVKEGNLRVRVPETSKDDEFGILERAFNLMISQISTQQTDLINVNAQLNRRRRFIEQIFSGVSSGIISTDKEGNIKLINKVALRITGLKANEYSAQDFQKAAPELFTLLDDTTDSTEGEITLTKPRGQIHLFVRIVADNDSYIITFDDISKLVAAKRQDAWQDVAKRIAHEIKNPLTPIYLATQRLKKKYAHQIADEQFTRYLDTIAKHVDAMSRMVGEFVNYSRLPAPVFATIDLRIVLSEAIFSQQTGFDNVKFIFSEPPAPIKIWGDAEQLQRAIENLLKNAAEALEATENPEIIVATNLSGKTAVVSIKDNGTGFPVDLINRVTEPYVTTRVKGMGLGLAIVQKIVDDHKGSLELQNQIQGGAHVNILLPVIESQK